MESKADFMKKVANAQARDAGKREPYLMEGTVSDIPDEQLLRRAVANCRDDTMPSGVEHPRWTGVMRTFALGSTYSYQLCRRFGLDPEEMVVRNDRD